MPGAAETAGGHDFPWHGRNAKERLKHVETVEQSERNAKSHEFAQLFDVL